MLWLRRLIPVVIYSLLAAQPRLSPPDVSPTPPLVTQSRCSVQAPLGQWDALAKFLAGLNGAEYRSLLSGDEQAAWDQHAELTGSGWSRVQARFLNRIVKWRDRNIDKQWNKELAFYPFSGPDAANVLHFFPEAREYVLIGLEPVGCLPSGTQAYTGAYFSELRKSLDAILSVNFFRTNDMSRDLRHTSLNGVLPLLLFMVSRSGYTVTDVSPLIITSTGEVLRASALVKGETSGVAIHFSDQARRERTLRYFSLNLQDSRLARKPGTLKYLDSLPEADTLVKSASYLMHKSYFSKIRNTILTKSRVVVEDDSGIPYRYFNPESWSVRLYGTYSEPINLFTRWKQEDLKLAFESQEEVEPLSFAIGYRHPWESNLLVAAKVN